MPRLPLSLVLLIAFSAAAAEVPVSDPQITQGSSVSVTRELPVVVAGDEGFLVVWNELYSGAYPNGAYARAYDADGSPLQPFATWAGSTTPQVVWTGVEYLAVSAIARSRFGGYGPTFEVLRLRRDGTRVAPSVRHIDAVVQTGQGSVLSLAWNGTHAMALVRYASSKHLLLLDGEGKLVADTPVTEDVVAVAPKGDSFFLLHGGEPRAISEGNARYAVVEKEWIAILDGNGAELERVPVAGARTLSWDGSAWHTAYVNAGAQVCEVTFSKADDVQSNCASIPNATNPSVGAIPSRTLLAWEGADEQIVTQSGIASMFMVPQHAVASTVDSTGLLLAWIEGGDIRLGGLNHDGTRRPVFFIPHFPVEDVGLAANGDRSLIVFRSNGEVFAMRLEANGAPLHPILALGSGDSPRVVAHGDGWVVVRNSGEGHIRITSISRDAIIRSERELTATAGVYSSPSIASTGDGLLAGWPDASGDFQLQRLDANAAPVGAPVKLAVGNIAEIACGPSACLVVLQPNDIAAILVSHGGLPLSELQPTGMTDRNAGLLTGVAALPDSTFRVYTSEAVAVVAADGTPRGWFRWSAEPVEWGGVETFNGRTLFFYNRDGGAYLRDLPARSRAVRH
jgi:hypothetical protein